MQQFHSVYIQFPNSPLRMSDRLANSSASFLRSRLSRISWCTWQTATALSLGCVIVLRNQVLSRRRALNDLSDVHELAGHNSISLIKPSTCGKMDLTSGVMFCMTVCAYCKVVYSFWSVLRARARDRPPRLHCCCKQAAESRTAPAIEPVNSRSTDEDVAGNPEYSGNNRDARYSQIESHLSKSNQISIAYCQIESFDSQIESQHASNRNLNRIAIWFCPPVLTIMLKMFACVLFIAQNFLQCLIRQVLWRALSIESTAKSVSCSYDMVLRKFLMSFSLENDRSHATGTAGVNLITTMNMHKQTITSLQSMKVLQRRWFSVTQ